MSAPEYNIAGVADFLKVPEEKIAGCLRDFEMWLRVCRMKQGIDAELAGSPLPLSLRTDSFRWVDDGEVGISSVQVTCADTGEVVAELTGDGVVVVP